MDPIIFDLGSTAIGWHGVLMLAGIVVAALLSVRLAAAGGIPKQFVYTSAFWIVLFGLIGARLMHVLDNLDFFSENPVEIFAFWAGGLSWYGALLGGTLAGVVCARVNKIPLGRFADTVAPAIMLGLAIGRIGCTINGDAYGTPTGLPWGLVYTHPNSYADLFVAGHPAPVYEIIWLLLIFGLLWRLKSRIKPDGSLFLIMVAVYSFGRFLISWVRAESAVLGPLHQAHIISLVLFAVATAWLVYRKTRIVAAVPPEEIAAEPSAAVTQQGQSQEH